MARIAGSARLTDEGDHEATKNPKTHEENTRTLGERPWRPEFNLDSPRTSVSPCTQLHGMTPAQPLRMRPSIPSTSLVDGSADRVAGATGDRPFRRYAE